ncbi:MAG: ion transporter [Bacteroidetes bacterium]|nr:ion transporter [Bacteroidota bacterium]MBS1630995.1 ion transporter [Bacteroidota bacterium]
MYHSTKKKVHGLLHPEIVGDTHWDRIINVFIIVLIILNVIAIMLETVPSIYQPHKKFFHDFDLFSVIVFTIEYVLRVWSSNHDPRFKHSLYGRLRYMISPAALIDLIAILPFYIFLFLPVRIMNIGSDFRLIRILRLLRFFRLFRLTAYTKSTRLVVNVLKSRLPDLMLSFVLTSFLIILASCLVYFAEHDSQPEKFSSIPATIYWAVVTLATVGYGDMVPITLLGKTFTVLIILMGVALLALPAGIITSGFIEEARKSRKPRVCPHCGKSLDEHPEHS